MRLTNVQIPAVSFPGSLVSDSEKESKDYGLQVGQAIQHEWFKRDRGQSRYYDQSREFHRLRLYARGEQSVAKYKKEMAVDGDLSYLNLDWTPVPVIPKFVDIVVNGMSDRLFKVGAYAQDALSQANRNKYQDMIEGQMAARPVLEMIQENTGANPFITNPDDLPEDDDELSLHMQLKYKPAIEIAEEQAIHTVFAENRYEDIKKRVNYDIATLGIGIAKHEFLPGSGIELNYVDPANAVYSYTEDPYFRDCFYWGEVKTIPVSELNKINPDLEKDEIEEIVKSSSDWYDYHNVTADHETGAFSNDSCTLLYFNYKTTKKVVYKKKLLETGGSRVLEKDDTFNPTPEMLSEGRFEKIEKTISVWYEGFMVMGTDILLKWDLSKNMVRPKSSAQHAISNYVAVAPRMYKGNIESLVRRMIPFADLIQLTHLKLQQVLTRLVPDGVYIDADGLNEVDLGTGAAYNPEDALRLYFQTGSVIGRSFTQDGEFNHARIPIQELTHSSGSNKAQMLFAAYNHYLNSIRTVTGLNEARDASTPDPNSLVGLQKLAALNSNTATRHILDGSMHIYKSLAEAITYRVADILEYSDFKDDFINKIGRYNVSILNEISDLYLYDFGIFIEISPDEEQRAQLEQNIQIALSKNDIFLEDAIDIREVRNIKMANQLLKLKRKKKQEREERMEMQKQQMVAQQNMQSQQMAARIAMKKQDMEIKGKMRLKQTEIAFEIEKLKNEAALKSKLMAEEFEYNQQIHAMNNGALERRETLKEDSKSDRISQQNTEQSKLINQRKNNLPAVDFESNEDSLDGFDLAEFSPR